jgi:hypothetical protein
MSKKDDKMKQILLENFNYLKELPIREYILYRKWIDIRQKYNINDINKIKKVKDNIWLPVKIDDYLNLEPELIFTTDKKTNFIWNTLRNFCSSAVWHQSPGRLLRYYIQDKKTKRYIGVMSHGSDFISVGGRDSYIGWNLDDRLKNGMLKYTTMGSTIVPVQPFGFNYNGGKLIALLSACDVIQDKWYEKYGEELAGVTTTSLFGGNSMYNRLKYWRKCKSTNGKISLEPSEDVYDILKDWYKEKKPEIYKKSIKGSHPKPRVLNLIYKELNIKPPINNFPRGVYWNSLYTNTNEFLSRKDKKLKDKKYDNSVKALTVLWKERYSKKRVENLSKDNNFKKDILFYDDMITKNWNDIKNRYL